MTSDGEALTGLSFVDEPSALQVTQSLPVFAAASRWLDLYFSGKVPEESISRLFCMSVGSVKNPPKCDVFGGFSYLPVFCACN